MLLAQECGPLCDQVGPFIGLIALAVIIAVVAVWLVTRALHRHWTLTEADKATCPGCGAALTLSNRACTWCGHSPD